MYERYFSRKPIKAQNLTNYSNIDNLNSTFNKKRIFFPTTCIYCHNNNNNIDDDSTDSYSSNDSNNTNNDNDDNDDK